MTEFARKSTPKSDKNEESYLFLRLKPLMLKRLLEIAPRFLCHFRKRLALKGLLHLREPIPASVALAIGNPKAKQRLGLPSIHWNGLFDPSIF